MTTGSRGSESPSTLWNAATELLRSTLSEQAFSAWIKSLRCLDAEEREDRIQLTLQGENEFFAKWVTDHHLPALRQALETVSGKACDVVVKAAIWGETEGTPESGASRDPLEVDALDGQAESPISRTPRVSVTSPAHSGSGISPSYRFDNFIVGFSNRFSHAAASAVAEQPGKQYNPLFLYSPPGLGKTHLLHAIGNHLLARNPDIRVSYLVAENFVNEFVESVQKSTMPRFRAKFRDECDVILMDDIQNIVGKEKSEEEFFHTFNALHGSKRQIVLTSDRPPKEIIGLAERVRSRFQWGLVVDIKPPEIETRIAILRAKAERDDIYLPDAVATFIATYVKSSIRDLEGALVKVSADASLLGSEISLEMAKDVLQLEIPEEGAQVTVESILSSVTRHFGLKPHDLRSKSRGKRVLIPRQIAMYLLRKYAPMTLNDIGEVFGSKDHTTVRHSCQKIQASLDSDSEIRESVEAIQNSL